MKTVDLHVHSTRSDGSLSPSALVDLALQKGLSAFALTDHDTIDGLERRLLHVGESGGTRLAAAMERYCSDSGFFAKEV